MSADLLPSKSWTLDQLATYVLDHGRQSAHSAWLVGKALTVAKDNHPKGAYVAWLKTLSVSVATAYRYVAVASKLGEEEVKGMTLWEAYERASAPSGSKSKGSKPAKASPRHTTATIHTLARFVASKAWERWPAKDQRKLVEELDKLKAAVETMVVPVGDGVS